MNYKASNNNWRPLLSSTILLLLVLFVSGCANYGQKSVILTSREEVFIIPAGANFVAIQPPNITIPQEFIAPETLVVLYKGQLLELEEAANKRVLKAPRQNKMKALIGGGIVSLLGIGAGLIKKFKGGKK